MVRYKSRVMKAYWAKIADIKESNETKIEKSGKVILKEI